MNYTHKHTHKAMDADTLAIVDTRDGCDNIVDEGLRKSLANHCFLQGLIHQGKKTIATHGMKEFIHSGERVTILLILVDPVNSRIYMIIKTCNKKRNSNSVLILRGHDNYSSSSPHKFVQNTLHPHMHSEKAEPVSPEHAQEVYYEPVTLLKHELLPIKDRHFRGDIFPRRNT